MFYESLFNPSIHRPVKACLTGAGEFGASFLFQAQGMPLLEVPAVCTRTVQRAVDAYENAGIPASKVRVCESAEDAKKAYADGFNVVVDSFEYIADLPLDVLVESSGAPEASAAAAELAIERGMHVVMVSKETDSVVGSILARKAAERGLVYTTGDGDQPSLLIGLISWGRVLGMNIVGAGKSMIPRATWCSAPARSRKSPPPAWARCGSSATARRKRSSASAAPCSPRSRTVPCPTSAKWPWSPTPRA